MDIFVQQRQLHNWCDSSLLGRDFLSPWVSLLLSVQLFGHQLLGFWGFSWGVWWWQPHFTNTKHVDIVRLVGRWLGTLRDFAWLRVTVSVNVCKIQLTFLWMYSKNEYIHGISRDFAWLRVTSRDFVTYMFISGLQHSFSSYYVFFCKPYTKIIATCRVQRATWHTERYDMIYILSILSSGQRGGLRFTSIYFTVSKSTAENNIYCMNYQAAELHISRLRCT